MVSNEVFVGAGTMATLVPEMDMYFDGMSVAYTNLNSAVLASADSDKFKLLDNLYVGCRAKITNSNPDPVEVYFATVTANTENSFYFDTNISDISSGNEVVDVKILGFGAPVIAPSETNQKLLSDNWLGLVNSFSPPSVDVETKQLPLMGGNTRNLSLQYRGAETVSGGSLDISLNNGSWLYYALGKVSTLANSGGSDDWDANTTNKFIYNNGGVGIARVIATGIEYPPLSITADTAVGLHDSSSLANYNEIGSSDILTYTFGEANGASLPSFGLDVSYRKAGVSASTAVDNLTPHENMYSRIFTGCQVNTLTLNFEEGQELKTSLDLVTRRAYDVDTDGTNDYIPHNAKLNPSDLQNFSDTASDNYPFMFSDGALTVFGQTFGRVKSGSVTINNNITPQRYIGNTSRQVMNEHIPAQRTYEISMTALITDTTLWDELRKEDGEIAATNALGADTKLSINFSKGGANNEFIKLSFSDYIIQTVDIPFPEDKGAIEVTFTASARTLNNAQYQGKWALMH